MFHTKLSTMRFGASTIINSVNRLQFNIDASTNCIGSIQIATTSYPCRYRHVLCTDNKKTTNLQNNSMLIKYSANVSIIAGLKY